MPCLVSYAPSPECISTSCSLNVHKSLKKRVYVPDEPNGTQQHAFWKTLTLAANGYLSIAQNLTLHLVSGSKEVLAPLWIKWIWSCALRETAFKMLNCCAWTCHYHSSALFLTHQKDLFCCLIKQQLQTDFFFLTNQLLIALLLPKKCLILAWQRSSKFKKLWHASRPGTAHACFLCSRCYSDFKSVAF